MSPCFDYEYCCLPMSCLQYILLDTILIRVRYAGIRAQQYESTFAFRRNNGSISEHSLPHDSDPDLFSYPSRQWQWLWIQSTTVSWQHADCNIAQTEAPRTKVNYQVFPRGTLQVLRVHALFGVLMYCKIPRVLAISQLLKCGYSQSRSISGFNTVE